MTEIQALLGDKNFLSLVNLSARRCLTWEEFLTLPQPQDMSPVDTWTLLSELNEAMGVPLNLVDAATAHFWYRRTHELDAAVYQLAAACRTDSRLDRVMAATSGQHFLTKSRMDETIAAAQLDGLAITEREAERLIGLDRAPQNATERLVLNTMNAFDHVPDLVDEPFTRELFVHLHDLLLTGVDPEELLHKQPSLGVLVGLDIPDEAQTAPRANDQMDVIAQYLDGRTADPDDLVVMRALVMSDTFRYNHALGVVSSQVGRLCGRLYALKNGLPVLGLLPVSRAKLAWENGVITPPMVSFNREHLVTLRRLNPADSTAYHTLVAQLALVSLLDLETHIETWERQDQEMRQILHADPLLNHRQRTVLARAIRNPDSEFRIRYHQTNHNIHYTTARRDLLELEEKGYLVMQQRGKAFVFMPGIRLQELAAQRRG